MSTFILDEALEVIAATSEGDESEEIPILPPPVVRRSRKRGHIEFSSGAGGEQENRSGEKVVKTTSSKLPSKKKKGKRVTRPLSSDSEETDHEQLQEGNGAVDKQPQTRDEIILNELKKTNKLLHSICKRVEKNEVMIKKVEKQHSSPGASTPKSSRNKDVPPEVRVSPPPHSLISKVESKILSMDPDFKGGLA